MDIVKIESDDELKDVVKHLRDGAAKTDGKVLDSAQTLGSQGFEALRKTDSRVLADTRLMQFRRVPIWIGFVDKEPVTLHAMHVGKKKANAWTPHANSYIAFTKVSERRKGYASHLFRHVRALAAEAGCVRMKALIGTVLGVRFHQHFGDHIWALNDKQMFAVDTPLVDSSRFPSGVTPMSVRPLTDRVVPMTDEEIEQILSVTTLGYEE